MNVLSKISITVLIILSLACNKKYQRQAPIELEGTAYLVGNEPFTQTAIEINDSTIYILKSENDLKYLQNQHVKIKGFFSKKSILNTPCFNVIEIRKTR